MYYKNSFSIRSRIIKDIGNKEVKKYKLSKKFIERFGFII